MTLHKTMLLLAVSLTLGASAADARVPFGRRIVRMDAASLPRGTNSLSALFGHVRGAGYNALVLDGIGRDGGDGRAKETVACLAGQKLELLSPDAVRLHRAEPQVSSCFCEDPLLRYARQGVPVVGEVPNSAPETVYAFCEQASLRRCAGVCVDIGPSEMLHPGLFVPILYVNGLRLSDPAGSVCRDNAPEALARLFPMLTDAEREAVRTVCAAGALDVPLSVEDLANARDPVPMATVGALRMAVSVLKSSVLRPCQGPVPSDRWSPAGIVEDLVLTAQWSLLSPVLIEAAPHLVRPSRNLEDAKQAKAAVLSLGNDAKRIFERRREEAAVWGEDAVSTGDLQRFESFLSAIEKLPGRPYGDEWMLELPIVLPKRGKIPRWTVEARFGGKWIVLCRERAIRPGSRDGREFTHAIPLMRHRGTPEAVRVTCRGEGPACLRAVALEGRSGRWTSESIPDGGVKATETPVAAFETKLVKTRGALRQECGPRPQQTDSNHWWVRRLAEKHDELAMLQGRDVDVVMLGDSITHRWESNDGQSLLARLRERYSVLCLGFGSDRTDHLLWRLWNGHADGYRAKVFTLMIGTNNVYDPPEEVVQGVKSILGYLAIRQPQAKVVLFSILPYGKDIKNPHRAKNEKTNPLLKGLCDGQKTFWVDFGEKLLAPDGSLDQRFFVKDMVHLSPAGYEIWYNTLGPILKELLDK